uniref:Small ribosomal subunit protein uS3m n=1 Tax=Lactifluus hygrophoroides TaxID=1837245 RepID=A0A2Z4M9E9_9AGAM|nr:ribosomal protein S3 [Lactifluus hygrophoroides]AWX52947.1 ribosomal protein S3 [Lactifluus hygrophoroides]
MFENNSNIKISHIFNLPYLLKYLNKGTTNPSLDNIPNRYKEIEFKSKKDVSITKVNKNLQIVKELSHIITKNNFQLNLTNKNQFNLSISENLNNELTKSILNDSNSIIINVEQYIKLISPFNTNLASFSNNIYTFTNRPYKHINKILYNLYTICKSVFLNLSSIISKPIVSMNPSLIKITLFFYWKPLKNKYSNSNLYSKFLILHYNKLKNFVKLLSKLFKKSVELELIRVYSPQNESNILANLIGNLSNFIKFRFIHMKLFKLIKLSKTKNSNNRFNNRFNNNKIPSFLSGISLKLAGRVLTQRIQKRVKSKIVQKGTLARTNVNLININNFDNKNKRGTFNITIKIGHKINN